MGIITNSNMVIPEGEFITKWIYNRMVVKNKNVILATTGATGSGKTYVDIKIYENWCKKMGFKPSVTYICFSILEVMKLLTSKDLQRYSLIILEEAGTSLGNLDFQQRVSKLFTYILQSFRSMNIGLIMNLPVFTMLNKSARQLVHAHLITHGIDYEKKQVRVKCYFHQLNQATGKSYWKSPRVKLNRRVRKLSYLNFGLADKELIEQYELKKEKFVLDLSQNFVDELNKLERDKILKIERKDLTDLQQEVFRMLQQGSTQTEIARLKKETPQSIHDVVKAIKSKGYIINSLEKPTIKAQTPYPTPI